MWFFVNPAIATGLLLSVTGLSSVAHATLPPQQATCSAATISGTYEGRGSGMSSLETPGKGKVEPETHTVQIVADRMGNYVIDATHFVEGRRTREFTGRKGTYTVDGACNVVFTRVWPEDHEVHTGTGTVTKDGNKIFERMDHPNAQKSTDFVRVPLPQKKG